MLSRQKRSGYGLFQLLVVIAVIAILIGILLPAVVRVRMAAGRMTSQNNLKQLGLAVHNYESANGKLVAGVDAKHFSAHAHLLPFIEQDNVYRLIDFKKESDDKDNARVRAVLIKTFMNPQDELAAPDQNSGPTSYMFVAGSKSSLEDNDGMFYKDSALTFANVTDGTSNTIMTLATLRGDGTKKATTVARQHVRLKEGDLKNIKKETGVKDFKDDKNIAGDRGAAWIDGRYLKGTISITRGFNDEKPDVDCGGAGGHAGPRAIEEGVNIGFGDGSVRFVTSAVKLETWQALATRGGGEVVQLD